jgi:Xaa-Pro aminopeptidase
MRSDLDRVMAERELDWLVLIGTPAESPDIHHLVRGARVGHCYVLKRRGEEPFVVVGSMERDEARAAGLAYATLLDYGSAEVAAQGLPPLEQVRRIFLNVLEKHGVRGRTAFGGAGQVGSTFPLVHGALAARPEILLVEELDMPAATAARLTKSEDEVARIRSVARRTEEVVGAIVALLRSCRAEKGVLVREGGAPLKIGDVKDRISLELAARRLDDHGQTIFAAGREAGFPHSRGTETEPVPLGKTIIFDIFPQEKGGGYYFDFTRTFWIGAVPERVRQVYDAVAAAFDRAITTVRAGERTATADAAACDAFEERGFVTKRRDPRTEVGYCHSLGHGVGLEIHERPHLSIRKGFDRDVFIPGQVFTIEPGLYYPDEEIGVRIEDTLYLRPDGTLENLAAFGRSPAIEPAS